MTPIRDRLAMETKERIRRLECSVRLAYAAILCAVACSCSVSQREEVLVARGFRLVDDQGASHGHLLIKGVGDFGFPELRLESPDGGATVIRSDGLYIKDKKGVTRIKCSLDPGPEFSLYGHDGKAEIVVRIGTVTSVAIGRAGGPRLFLVAQGDAATLAITGLNGGEFVAAIGSGEMTGFDASENGKGKIRLRNAKGETVWLAPQ